MRKITKTYANTNNGGQEKITRDGDKFFISSDWGKGFCQPQEVTRQQAKIGLDYTDAPADIVVAILGA
jgi:hypothetical protein